MKKLTDAFNEAAVAKGEVFAIELPNPSIDGGYMWDLRLTSGKATLLSSDQISPPGGCIPGSVVRYPGRGLKEVFVFRAEEAGDIKIDAALKRPWDGDAPPLKTQSFSLTVK